MSISTEIDFETVRRFRWFGWLALGTVVVGWAGWVSLSCVNSYVVQERETQHFEQLRDDVGRVADDVAEIKQLLLPTNRFASRED